MDATPLFEHVVRLATAIVAVWAFWESARAVPRQPRPMRPLLVYLTVVLGLIAVWRTFLLVFGAVADPGSWLDPYVRSLGATLIMLLLFGVGLIAAFHQRHD